MMVQASFRAGRYFDCIQHLESRPDIVDYPSALGSELRCLALSSYLEVRQLDRAGDCVHKCLLDAPNAPDLLLKKASILALDSRYEESAEQLLVLNRRLPNRPAILKRLVAVYEQMRDMGKAVAFLRAYLKAVPRDAWALEKSERYRALGIT
jgi:serine/threonine-protein kinase